VQKWIENSPEENDLEVFVDELLNMSWQCVLVVQKASLEKQQLQLNKKRKGTHQLYFLA